MDRWYKVFAFIVALIAIYSYFNNTINDKIEQKLKDPEFIRKVADEVRLPFVIFDENKTVSVDTGAMKYIVDFEIKKGETQEISEIIISPKSFMALPPLLESIDAKEIEFEKPKRGNKFDLIYKTVRYDSGWGKMLSEGSKPQLRFRLQLVEIPKQ